MKVLKYLSSLFLCLLIFASCTEKTVSLKVLQINTWYQCEKVPNGLEGLVSTVQQTDPDVIFLCEWNTKDSFVELKKALKAKGMEYEGEHLDMAVAILSKYKIEDMHLQYR